MRESRRERLPAEDVVDEDLHRPRRQQAEPRGRERDTDDREPAAPVRPRVREQHAVPPSPRGRRNRRCDGGHAVAEEAPAVVAVIAPSTTRASTAYSRAAPAAATAATTRPASGAVKTRA